VARRGSSAAQGTAAGGTSDDRLPQAQRRGWGRNCQPTKRRKRRRPFFRCTYSRKRGQPLDGTHLCVCERTHVRTRTQRRRRGVAPHTRVHEARLSCGHSFSSQERSGSKPPGRARGPCVAPCRATFGDSATRGRRAPLALPQAPRPLALEPGHGPAAATPAAAATAGTRLPPATRARADGAALPDPTQGALGGQSQKNCQLPEECASPVQVAD